MRSCEAQERRRTLGWPVWSGWFVPQANLRTKRVTGSWARRLEIEGLGHAFPLLPRLRGIAVKAIAEQSASAGTMYHLRWLVLVGTSEPETKPCDKRTVLAGCLNCQVGGVLIQAEDKGLLAADIALDGDALHVHAGDNAAELLI